MIAASGRFPDAGQKGTTGDTRKLKASSEKELRAASEQWTGPTSQTLSHKSGAASAGAG